MGSDATTTNMNSSFFIIQLWALLSTCDGLCGSTLGHASKIGFFAIVSWLSNIVTYGPQMIHNNHYNQCTNSSSNTTTSTTKLHANDEYNYPCTIEFGVPLPQIIIKLKQIINDETNSYNHNTITTTSLPSSSSKHHLLFHEIVYISSMFEYIHRRLTSNLIISQ